MRRHGQWRDGTDGVDDLATGRLRQPQLHAPVDAAAQRTAADDGLARVLEHFGEDVLRGELTRAVIDGERGVQQVDAADVVDEGDHFSDIVEHRGALSTRVAVQETAASRDRERHVPRIEGHVEIARPALVDDGVWGLPEGVVNEVSWHARTSAIEVDEAPRAFDGVDR